MHTTRTSSARRTLARVAVAGVLTAIPLTTMAIPASATPAVPGLTEVHRGDDCRKKQPWQENIWENRHDNPWDNDRDRCERRRKPHEPRDPFDYGRPHLPGIWFGSS
ncbi:hypothetical protein AB0H76_04565 [Nocardia sp. NPDC050712]|uniref:hypothetical protein n=1 Tax=Nocardia sp. NPDC050712 TaxID=3155518 RepID=UPI0033FC1BF4